MTEKERLALESIAQEMCRRQWKAYKPDLYELKEILERHLQSPFA